VAEMYPAHPAADLFPMLPEAELAALAESIKANGLRQPIVLCDERVLDGRNRQRACALAGVAPTFVQFIGGNPWQYVWDLNAERRHLEPGQKGALAVQFYDHSEAWKAERKRLDDEANAARAVAAKNQHAAKGGGASIDAPPPKEPKKKKKKAKRKSALIAASAKVSQATIERAQALKEIAPGLFEAVCRGEITLNKALTQIKRAKRVEKIAEITMRPVSPLEEERPSAVIYADPPWSYENTASVGAVADEYPTMPLAEICAMKVPATSDAVLFLWATSPLLPEALQVITAWGFTYKGSMIWDKGHGTGNWVLNAHELLLIAVRGDMPCPKAENRPLSVVRARKGEHSAKPDEFAALITRMYPEFEPLELFGRKPRPGFRVWGNQAA
jgi:N6-adenosine-specific RNA methylase IME4